jgi:integrase
MSRSNHIPKYSLHKPSGQARVIIGGKHHYLGKFGSSESRTKYAALIGKRFHEESKLPESPPGKFPLLTIDELILHYLDHARTYYCFDGKPTKEYTCMEEAVRHLRPLYGNSEAKDFGPNKLTIVRETMIVQRLARTVINNRINRIKRAFKWAVSRELIPPSVYQAIRTLDGLRFGRSNAKETDPVKPVLDSAIKSVTDIVSPQIAAMVWLQRYTGMRPGEVVIMRPCDIKMSGKIWVFEPYTHKNKYRGHSRLVPLGPKSQAQVKPFLNRKAEQFMFSPAEAEAWRSVQRRKTRKSPMTPSHAKRKSKSKPKRKKRDRYDTASYRRAISYAIKKLNKHQNSLPKKERKLIPHWHPHQLRHQFATIVREQLGAEAVQIGLGHKSTDLVDLYAEKNLAAARQIAGKIG